MDIETIIKLLLFCLTSTVFQYNRNPYKQLDGVAVGSPVLPVITDIFMEELEEQEFADHTLIPRIWKRFVDNVQSVVKKTLAKSYFVIYTANIQTKVHHGRRATVP